MSYADKLEKLADEAEQGCGCSETFHKLRCAYVEAKDDLGMAGYSKPSQARKVASLVRAADALCSMVEHEWRGVTDRDAGPLRKALADIEGEGGAATHGTKED